MTPRNGEADAAEADDYFTNCFLEKKKKKNQTEETEVLCLSENFLTLIRHQWHHSDLTTTTTTTTTEPSLTAHTDSRRPARSHCCVRGNIRPVRPWTDAALPPPCRWARGRRSASPSPPRLQLFLLCSSRCRLFPPDSPRLHQLLRSQQIFSGLFQDLLQLSSEELWWARARARASAAAALTSNLSESMLAAFLFLSRLCRCELR